MDTTEPFRSSYSRVIVRHFIAGALATCGLLMASCENDSSGGEDTADGSTEQNQIVDEDDAELSRSQIVGTYRGEAGTSQVPVKLKIESYDGQSLDGWLQWPGDARDVYGWFDTPASDNMITLLIASETRGSDPDDVWDLHWRTDVLEGVGEKYDNSEYRVYLTRVK